MFMSIKELANIEEIEPDEWDLAMIKHAEEENDGETISLESFAKEILK